MNAPIIPISLDTVLRIHEDQLAKHGGLAGIRDKGLLESALAQPFASFGGFDLYPTLAARAARYAYGIVTNHPFNDGNKRTGTALLIVFLRANGVRFKPRHDDFYRTIIGVADGSISFEALVDWVNLQIGPQESH